MSYASIEEAWENDPMKEISAGIRDRSVRKQAYGNNVRSPPVPPVYHTDQYFNRSPTKTPFNLFSPANKVINQQKYPYRSFMEMKKMERQMQDYAGGSSLIASVRGDYPENDDDNDYNQRNSRRRMYRPRNDAYYTKSDVNNVIDRILNSKLVENMSNADTSKNQHYLLIIGIIIIILMLFLIMKK